MDKDRLLTVFLYNAVITNNTGMNESLEIKDILNNLKDDASLNVTELQYITENLKRFETALKVFVKCLNTVDFTGYELIDFGFDWNGKRIEVTSEGNILFNSKQIEINELENNLV